MSDSASPVQPVSLFKVFFVLVLCAAFLLVVRRFYHPAATAPQNAAAENLPQELEWRATAKARRATLKDLHEKETAQASSYAWIDQKAGVVQLPLSRAMELTAQRYGAQK